MFWVALPVDCEQVLTKRHQQPSAQGTIEARKLVTDQTEEALPRSLVAIGHISLDKIDSPPKELQPDESLVSSDGSTLTVTSLFIHPAYGADGLGAFAMDLGVEPL